MHRKVGHRWILLAAAVGAAVFFGRNVSQLRLSREHIEPDEAGREPATEEQEPLPEPKRERADQARAARDVTKSTRSTDSKSVVPPNHPERTIATSADGRPRELQIAELDQLLDADDGESRALAASLAQELGKVLKDDPVAKDMEVRCAAGFCRLRLEKSVSEGMAWHEVDNAIAPVTRGEAIFRAETNEQGGRAYVYFVPGDSTLPLSAPLAVAEEE